MMTVIVLGMHRSGTSMTAEIVKRMGVHMGDRLLGGQRVDNPGGHCEDLDFLGINKQVLDLAGGDWRNVPAQKAIRVAFEQKRGEIAELIAQKAAHGRDWGWKDPRTAVMARCYLDLMAEIGIGDIRIVWTQRRSGDIVQSLIRRNGGKAREWALLAARYTEDIHAALARVRYPVYVVNYEQATNRKRAHAVVAGLSRFLGRADREAERGIDAIRIR